MTVLVLARPACSVRRRPWRCASRGERVVARVGPRLACRPSTRGLQLVDVEDRPVLARLLAEVGPSVVVNCIGAKPGSEARELVALNSELPRWLAGQLDASGVVDLSTSAPMPCSPLSGRPSRGHAPRADRRLRSRKLAGEVTHEPHLTIRTSIVGPHRRGRIGLLEWFRRARARLTGTPGSWNGVTTLELARFLGSAWTSRWVGSSTWGRDRHQAGAAHPYRAGIRRQPRHPPCCRPSRRPYVERPAQLCRAPGPAAVRELEELRGGRGRGSRGRLRGAGS